MKLASRAGRARSWWVAGVLAAIVASGLVFALVSSALAGPTITEFGAGITAAAAPNAITRGPDGAMWFTEYHADKIGRVAADGSVTEYPTSGTSLSAGADPSGIVTGPDGNIYFSEYQSSGNGAIGELNPTTGTLIGQYPTPTAGSEPDGIAVGADGGIWFAEQGTSYIGRLDPATHAITEYDVHVGTHLAYKPTDLLSGPDGSLWITLLGTGQIAQLDPTLALSGTDNGVTLYDLPSGAASGPEGIAVGPDGNLWVAEDGVGKIAQLNRALLQANTTTGVSEFGAGGTPLWISGAGDGALWLTDNTDHELLRFDTSTHTSTVYGSPQGITGDATTDAQDGAGNLWFTEFNSNKVGKVALAVSTGSPEKRQLPAVTGAVDDGQTVSCATGTWTNNPTSYSYQWQYNGTPVAGATRQEYTIPGSEVANNQLSCIVTATNAGGSTPATSAGVTIGIGAPARVVTQPTIHGATYDKARGAYVTSVGTKLTCDPGVWANATPFREVWTANIPPAVVGPFAAGISPTTTGPVPFAIGSSVVTPDYPTALTIAGPKVRRHTVITDIQCQVDAVSNGNAGPLSATAVVSGTSVDRVLVKALAPELVVSRSRKQHCMPSCGPVISPAVGYGQVNRCMPGRWLHYPTSYTFEWLKRQDLTGVPTGPAVVVAHKEDLRIGYSEERQYLYCRVTASNGAGAASAVSNGYDVPLLGFVARGVPQIKEERPGPARFVPLTAPLTALQAGSPGQFQFSCRAPSFNKGVASIDYYWMAYWDGGPDHHAALGDIQEGQPPVGSSAIAPASGVILDINESDRPVRMTTVGGTQSVRNWSFDAVGGVAVIGCYVYATAPDGQKAFAASEVTWIDMPGGTPAS